MSPSPDIVNGITYPDAPEVIRGRQLQNQARILANQEGTLALQQRQREMEADVAGRKMFADALQSGKEPEEAQIFATYGPVRGAQIIEARTKAKQAGLSLQETRGKIADAEKEFGAALGASTAAQGYTPEGFQSMLQQMRQAGYGSHAAQLEQAAGNDPAKMKQIVDGLIAASPKQQEVAASKQTASARAQQAATTAARETREAGQAAVLNPLQAQKLQQEVTGTAPIQPAQQAAIANQEAMRKQGAARLAVEQGNLDVARQRWGFEQGGGVSPQAQMIADGRMDPQTARSMLRLNPGLMKQVVTVDPNFDEANIVNRYNTLKEFTSTSNSKAGGQALALNTLIHHADLYQQTAQALKNGTFRPGNEVYNAVATAFGAPPPTNAALVARFFAGETGKVATGGVPAEGEVNGILKNLSTSASPQQIADAGKTLLQIAAGRAVPLMERAKQAKIDKLINVLGPDAQEILKRHGFDPATMQATGTIPSMPTRLSASDVGKTYRSKTGKTLKITAVNPNDPTQFQSEEVK